MKVFLSVVCQEVMDDGTIVSLKDISHATRPASPNSVQRFHYAVQLGFESGEIGNHVAEAFIGPEGRMPIRLANTKFNVVPPSPGVRWSIQTFAFAFEFGHSASPPPSLVAYLMIDGQKVADAIFAIVAEE